MYQAISPSAMAAIIKNYGAMNYCLGEPNLPLQQVAPPAAIGAAGLDELWRQIGDSFSQFASKYRASDTTRRTNMLLTAACASNVVFNNNPAWLTFSPFGWHGLDFLNLILDPDLPFADLEEELYIGCFGGGFHCEHSVPELAKDITDAIKDRDIATLLDAEQSLYGSSGATSFEPRELLALFLGGERKGSITVIDHAKEIGEELKQPRFARLNTGELWNKHVGRDSFFSSYWHVVAAGRAVNTNSHGMLNYGPLKSQKFEFTTAEMEKLVFVGADLLLGKVPVSAQSFDLSLWLESSCLFPREVATVLSALITDCTRLGGFILFDFRLSDLLQYQLGLNPIRAFTNLFNRPPDKGHPYANLYQRVAQTDTVERLRALIEKAD